MGIAVVLERGSLVIEPRHIYHHRSRKACNVMSIATFLFGMTKMVCCSNDVG